MNSDNSANFVTVTAIIPDSTAITAAMVGRALDSDVGGAQTFEANHAINSNGEGFRYASISGVIPTYAAGMRYLLGSPELLLATIELDTAARFPGAPVPTLEQCTEFCAACVVGIDGDIDVLAGLTLIINSDLEPQS